MNWDAMPLHFLRPLWLLALLALPAIAWLWRARRRQHSVWRETVDPHLLPHLLEGGNEANAWRMPWLGLLAFALAVIALAGPGWRQQQQPLWQTRAPLVVALDLSSATLANDLPPSRLLQARAKIASLLQRRAGGQVGLVAYADDAFTVAPLTDDVANVALFLDALSPEVMPADGHRGDRAIAWSQRLLEQAGYGGGDILLVTHSADADARAAAARAARDGYRVSVLGLGSAAGAAYRTQGGGIARTRLEADALRALASAGDGAYATVTADDGDLRALGVLDPQQAGTLSKQGKKGATWIDDGYWLLPPLMLLVLLAFRRGGALAALLLCLWWPPAPAHAAEASLWRRPDQQAHARMLQGAQAYRNGDFAAAARAFDGIDSADAHYNRGNALAKQGRYEEAIAAYDRALALQPEMEDAIANREAVRAALRRKPPPGDKQQQNRNQRPGQANPRQGGQGDPQDAQGQGQPSAKPRPPQARDGQQRPGDKPAPDATPADAEAQRAADEAQRARMQRALERAGREAGEGQEVEGRPERAETAAERERSIANEAWLRRVPDDPGGLLRAKFRLEHERRQAGGNR